MKNFYFKQLFAALLLLCSTVATAHDFQVGGIYYNITSSTAKTVAVTYRGSSYSEYSGEYSGAETIPSSVTYSGKTYSVTSIGERAFEGCSGLTSVTIPNSVTSIGSSAFSGCYGLKEVHISDLAAWCNIDFSDSDSNPLSYADNLYLNGEKVTNLVIPDGVTTIKNYAFYDCDGLTSVTIPNSVTSIGSSAFYGCRGLTSITIPNSVTSIGSSAFSGCYGLTSVTIGNSVTSIGYDAFYGCSGLKEVHISDLAAWCNVDFEDYDSNPLYYAQNLYLNGEKVADLVIPDGVTAIKKYAFRSCSGLTSITIPNSVTSIGSSAFLRCTGLTNVTIPNSVTSIGEYAFYGCSGLTSITIGNSVTRIGSSAFNYCSGLKEVINYSSLTFTKGSPGYGYVAYYADRVANIPGGSIEGDFAFGVIDGVNTLTGYLGDDSAVTLPDSYKGEGYVIGSFAFWGCDGLTSITIPNSVTSIGYDAFRGCTGLTSITIPNSVTSIGYEAFYGCSGLKEVHISDLAAWCNIDFSVSNSNPLSYADNLYLNGEKVTNLVIPDGVTTIKNYAFYDCDGLTSVTIPNSVTSIGRSAFSYCDGLTSITIPNSVTSIGDYAFYGCSGLTSVTIGNSVTSIGNYAFYGCTGLTSVTIGNSVTSIGNYAFYGCTGLRIVYNNSSRNITADSSNHGYVAYYANIIVTKDDDIQGDFIFRTADNTNTLIAYAGNDSVITLPENYNDENYAIGEKAFRNCTGLTNVTIPSSVTTIGNSAFYGCTGLTEIYSLAETPATITYSFNNYSATLYVPAGAKEAYQAANYWKNFTNIVEMEPEFTVGDINGDNKVDVGDVTILIEMILDASLLTDSGDINGDNKVDVGDVTTLVAIILGTNNTPARAAAMEEYNVELSVEGDEQSLTIDATATDYPYSAVQFDVYLPAGVKAIGNMVVGNGNAAAYKEQADGAVRVVIYSPSNTAIANKSASIAIDATGLALGSHPVEVKNIILAAPGRAKAIAWDSTGYITIAGITGIDGVVSDAGNADAVVYDLQGHRVTEIVKGRVYIKNGSKFIAQ